MTLTWLTGLLEGIGAVWLTFLIAAYLRGRKQLRELREVYEAIEAHEAEKRRSSAAGP